MFPLIIPKLGLITGGYYLPFFDLDPILLAALGIASFSVRDEMTAPT